MPRPARIIVSVFTVVMVCTSLTLVGADSRGGPTEARAATTLRAPAKLRGSSVTPRSFVVRWRAVAGASRYDIRLGGRHWRTVTATSARVTGRAPATSYDVTVTAIDSAGRRSAMSTFLPVTTDASTSCTIHAARSGSDANSGQSAGAAVRTVGKALSLARAGDVVCLRGTFVEDVTFHSTGSRAQPLTLRTEPGAPRALVRGRMWVPDAVNDIVITRLAIDGRNLDNGELPSPTVEGDRVRIIGNDITNHRHHICAIFGSIHGFGQARSAVVDRNRIHDCGRRPANNHHHALYLENAVGTRITNNVIIDSADRGIQLYPNSQRTLVARNIIFRNGEGVIFSGNEGYASNNNKVVDNVIAWSRLRYNIEYWWPAGNPVGRGNLAARNCVWKGAWGNIAEVEPGLPRGFTDRDNVTANPGFTSISATDFRPTSTTGCAAQFSGLAPMRPLT